MLLLKTKLRNHIQKSAKDMELEFYLDNISINGQKRGCYGFVRNAETGVTVYINTERSVLASVPNYMFRYAKDTRDYRGDHNKFANTLDELCSEVCQMLRVRPEKIKYIMTSK